MRRIILTPIKFLLGLKQSRIKKYIPNRFFNLLKIYNYYIWLAYHILTQDSERDIIQAIKVLSKSRKRILFYPDVPWEDSMIYQICQILRYGITNSVSASFDLAVKWKSTTFFEPDTILVDLAEDNMVVNIDCNDIGKSHVNLVFKEVFGYSSTVNPLTFEGKCVQKSILNALHDGKIINCPIKEANDKHIYQILVDNEVDDGFVMDIRVPVFKHVIPFVFLYFRPIEVRFSAEITKIKIMEISEVFTEEEHKNIIQFCNRMGLEYGELDVLRNKKDGKIYIVDANTTPHGPPIHLGSHKEGLKRLANTFAHTFTERELSDTII